MAKFKNVAGEPRELRFINRVVEDGEVFEVRDDIAKNLAFSPEIFQEITPAKKTAAPRKRAAKKASARKPAAKKAAAPKPPAEPDVPVVDGPPVEDIKTTTDGE